MFVSMKFVAMLALQVGATLGTAIHRRGNIFLSYNTLYEPGALAKWSENRILYWKSNHVDEPGPPNYNALVTHLRSPIPNRDIFQLESLLDGTRVPTRWVVIS